MFDNVLTHLSTLPLSALYIIAALVAAFENVFPPFPSDVVVALTVFISARAGAPFWPGALATWIGNVSGAMLMYFVGRRYGSGWLMAKLERYVGPHAEQQLRTMHARYGVTALFLSRFLPGVRALVPPFAGALKISTATVFVAIAVASAAWYGFIAYISFQTGENWPTLLAHLKRSTTLVTIIAVVVAAIWGVVWYIRKRRRNGEQPPETP
jgi:membrane protein DedA with SNARE-associated domain